MPSDPLAARWDVLRRVVDPCSIGKGVPINLVDMGLVKDVGQVGEEVVIELRLTHPVCWQVVNIVDEVDRLAGEIDDGLTTRVEVDNQAEWWPEMMSVDARSRLAARRAGPVNA